MKQIQKGGKTIVFGSYRGYKFYTKRGGQMMGKTGPWFREWLQENRYVTQWWEARISDTNQIYLAMERQWARQWEGNDLKQQSGIRIEHIKQKGTQKYRGQTEISRLWCVGMEREVDNMDKVNGSHNAYSHRKPSQMGGNHWLLRVYMCDNVRMAWLASEYIFRGCMCR
jgi:hypothetical protein